jgi:pimeloyl-ACP methyl ester carboxylesterase
LRKSTITIRSARRVDPGRVGKGDAGGRFHEQRRLALPDRHQAAGAALALVRSPTLLVVGSRDERVLALNARAARELRACVVETVVVPGATHLFEEPEAVEPVSRLAARWFRRYLAREQTA